MMASISVSEKMFNTVSAAAYDAKLKGDDEQAANLDVLARKINAALTTARANCHPAAFLGRSIKRTKFTWRDVPSVFDTGNHRPPPPLHGKG